MTVADGEQILARFRKHWFVFIASIIGVPVFAALPAIVLAVIPEVLIGPDPSADLIALIVWFYSTWLLVLWVFVFLRWTDYYLDMWIITPDRIIDVDQNGVFRREVSTIRYERIQDVTTEVNGLIATLLDFGTITVQSAGERIEVVMDGARSPTECKARVLTQMECALDENGGEQPEQRGSASGAHANTGEQSG